MDYDILIRGGLLIDGTGAPGRTCDLGIRHGSIVAIDTNLNGHAGKKIDADGLAVAPGFIDIKTHSDFTLPINPKAESKVRQGVTTEIIGHCGFSVAPCLPGKVQLLKDYLSPSAPWLPFRELSFPDYLDTFPRTAVNAGMLVGHNTLRLMVMGMDDRAPTEAELKAMSLLLEEGLNAGALGLSSGLFTSPGSYAKPDELTTLGRVLKKHKALYFTHLRDESDGVLDAVAEAIALAETCGVHTQIVHFKCSGVNNWGKVDEALRMMAEARARGVEVDCDAYPYTAGSNPLKNLMPQWVQGGGVDAMIARLKLPDTRRRIAEDIAREGLNNWGRLKSWDDVQISITPNLPQFAGRTIQSLATERNQDPIDTVCDYLIDDKAATRVLVTGMSEDDVRTLMARPEPMVGSDGNCVATYGTVSQGMPHPRFYGTFPRVLDRYCRQEGLLPLELAVNKMTGATARALRLSDRGLLRRGYRADVTIFDPADFKEQATYAKPHQYPSGARTTVIVNGRLVVEDASHTGALPGVVLRRGTDGMVG